MYYFDNIYLMDSASSSAFRISLNLINAITPAGPVAVGVIGSYNKISINKKSFDKISNFTDLYIKQNIITMGNYDKESAWRIWHKFLKILKNDYDLKKGDYSIGFVLYTKRFKCSYKYGRDVFKINLHGMMLYSSSLKNKIDKKSIRKLCFIKDKKALEKFSRELIERCRIRGEKDDIGIIFIRPKIRRCGINWSGWLR